CQGKWEGNYERLVYIEVDDLEQRIKNLKAIFFKLRDTKLKQKEVIVISDDDTSSDHDTSKDSHDCMSEDSSEDLINFLSSRDPQWQFPRQTEEEDPLPLDILFSCTLLEHLDLIETIGALDLVEVEAVGALDVVGLSLNILISASLNGYLTSLNNITSSSPKHPSSLESLLGSLKVSIM
ncbi:hypothetical protein Tco_1323439, partial [Tanacetum coccineum]